MLVTADSPTHRVGGKPREGFAKVARTLVLCSRWTTRRTTKMNCARGISACSGRTSGVERDSVYLRTEAGWIIDGAAVRRETRSFSSS